MYIEYIKEMENYKCSICNKDFYGYGNNPYPLCDEKDYKSRCCDTCNIKYVLAARMFMIQKDETREKLNQLKEKVNKQK